ncbi:MULTISPECIES: hypothetical protein [unclassified Pseudoalteromonas]|uniref:hypothetical protein n=1 Tax=unclassified Pseudoalteromonas TaxID=194690 RepID=UPI0030157081
MLLTLKKKQLKKLSNSKGLELQHTRKVAGGEDLASNQLPDAKERITHDYTSYTTG